MTDSTNVRPIAIQILGKEYRVACPADEQESLLNAAEELDKRMRAIRDSGKVSGTDRIAIMAALNLTHDLPSLQNSHVESEEEIAHQLSNLRNKIENTLKNSRSS
jgi:cell division protein ZapA